LKYSIIIPTLNEEKLLPELLKQLTSSGIKSKYDFEFIISDGGSTDKTIEMALPFADTIKIYRGSGKQNIAMGRNEGAKLASGEILVFINADILFHDINEFFRYVEKHFTDEYIALTCFVKIFPEEETTPDKLFHVVYNNFFMLLNNIGGGMGRGECQIVRKEAFQKVGGYNEEMAAGEDLDLFRRLKQLGKILFSNKIWIYESPRRYRKYGYSYITFSWIRNGLSVLFTNKSVSKEWEPIR
jgi:glycosyltransferase involved in cell wall biosynthesis